MALALGGSSTTGVGGGQRELERCGSSGAAGTLELGWRKACTPMPWLLSFTSVNERVCNTGLGIANMRPTAVAPQSRRAPPRMGGRRCSDAG